MNWKRLILIPALTLSFSACDKVKDVARQAMGAVNKGVKERLDGDEPVPDASLAKLVDQTEEGVIFRKDLPFPGHLRVITRVERKISGRVIQTTETGQRKVHEVDGREKQTSELLRDGDRLRYTLKESTFAVPTQDSEQAAKKIPNPFRRQAPASTSVSFVRTAQGWGTEDIGDFRAMTMSQQLRPVFDDLLVAHALMPRPLWFSKQRLKIGDEVVVSGEVIPLLLAGDAEGSLKLRLVKVDAVQGHPCGMFEISGDYRRRGFPGFDGSLTDQEVAIESGKIWLSLIHPIVLKEELKTIQTFKPSEGGGFGGRGQGRIEVSVEREWRPLGG